MTRRSRQGPRLLRLTAGLLAVLGLLGHGLAMLLVGLLAGAPAAAQTDFPAFLEICSADGLTGVVATELAAGGEENGDEERGPASGKIDGCPVCTAFAQNGAADLPEQLAPIGHKEAPARARPAHQIAAPAPADRLALSRGPPAA